MIDRYEFVETSQFQTDKTRLEPGDFDAIKRFICKKWISDTLPIEGSDKLYPLHWDGSTIWMVILLQATDEEPAIFQWTIHFVAIQDGVLREFGQDKDSQNKMRELLTDLGRTIEKRRTGLLKRLAEWLRKEFKKAFKAELSDKIREILDSWFGGESNDV